MVSLAILSDIHSNFEALKSVLRDIRKNYPEIKEIYCAGDTCGYGPEPVKCVEFILISDLVTKTVKGNHDDFVARSVTPPMTRQSAFSSISWQINVIPLELRWELSQLPQFITFKHDIFDTDIALVHGSPQYPLDEYIYPGTKKQEKLFEYMIKTGIDILILGHTHKPFVRKKANSDSGRELLMLNP
ncbi:MAG: metallophosphoesterase family protein, partial [Candidatus Hodarchaeales archaeon]